MMQRTLLAGILLLAQSCLAASPADALIARYSSGYRHFRTPYLALSYRDNIANLVQQTDIGAQTPFFVGIASELGKIDRTGLSACQHLDLDRIAFEPGANLEKLAVIEAYKGHAEKTASADGLHKMPAGR